MKLSKHLFYLLFIALTSITSQLYSQCPNQAVIDLLQQTGNSITVGTNTQAPIGNSFYSWNFGDGQYASGQFQSHTYSQAGVYIVSLTVYDSLQTSWCAFGTLTVQIVNPCNLNPAFSLSALDSGLVIFAGVTFQNAVLPVTYNWNFSNGQTSTSQTPSIFFNNGQQEACLTITDANGCVDSTCTNFFIDNACASNYLSMQPSMNQQNLILYVSSFNNQALPINLQIDFGDGTSQNGILTSTFTTQHAYPAGDSTYLVCVNAIDANGCTSNLCQLVTVAACTSLPVSFQSNIIAPGLYQFYASASGGQAPYLYSWNFGNGQTINSDSSANAQAILTAQGVYNVCLNVTDANGCPGSFCQDVVVTPCSNMLSQMVVSVTGLTVTATVIVTGGCNNYTYVWQSNGQTATTASAVFTFTQAGSYPVVLQVSDGCGCVQTITGIAIIGCGTSGGQQVLMQNGSLTLCNAQFFDTGGANGQYTDSQNYTLTLYPSTPGAKLRIAFSSVNLETNFDYLKIYNGASTSGFMLANLNGTQSNLTYTSTSPDGSLTFTFTSDLTVTSNGWAAQISCVDLSLTATDQNNGTWQLNANSSQNWTSYSWTIDGAPVSNTSSSFNYPLAQGQHQVCVTVSSALGCTEQVCIPVNVPCTYNVELETTLLGNSLTVNVLNYDSTLYYSIQSGQSWAQMIGGTATLNFMTGGTHQVCVYADGPCFDSTCVQVDLGTANTDLISGYVWDDANGNGLFDTNENPFGYVYVQLCQTVNPNDSLSCVYAYTDSLGYYSFNVFPGTFELNAYNWQAQNNLYVPTLPVNVGGYAFTTTGGTTITGFDFGYQNQSVTITGTVFYDTNNNGVQNAGELPATFKSVHIGNYWVSTNASGFYTLNIPIGSYSIQLVNPGNGYAISIPAAPFVYQINANTLGQTYANNNFGLWADPNLQDLSASITQISTVTPGFPVMTHLGYCNNGASAMSGTFTYYWDAQLAINSSSVFNPAPSTFNAANNTASWNFSNLSAGQCAYIYQNSLAPTSLVLGTPVFNSVIVTPLNDNYPSNNIDTLHQTVVGSWDPNDKQGTPSGIGEAGIIAPNTELSYTIRFQNTGSAPAVNVVLIDTISNEFILESIRMNVASHDYTMHIDINTRVVRWTFNGIMLPDSTSDLEGSNGFVNFSISPVQNQLDGTVLNNFADIYFDFNEPVRTNTTIHTIDRLTGIAENILNSDVEVYPNPFSNSTQFLVNTKDKSSAQVQIFNALGEKLAEFNVESGKPTLFNALDFTAGMYFYKVNSKQGVSSGKLIIR